MTVVFTDIYESMQKHVVNAATMNAAGGVVFSYPDVCRYYTAFKGVPIFAGYRINLKVWNSMPADIQTILLDKTANAVAWLGDIHGQSAAETKHKGFGRIECFNPLPATRGTR